LLEHIKRSQENSDWKGFWEISSPASCSKQGQPDLTPGGFWLFPVECWKPPGCRQPTPPWVSSVFLEGWDWAGTRTSVLIRPPLVEGVFSSEQLSDSHAAPSESVHPSRLTNKSPVLQAWANTAGLGCASHPAHNQTHPNGSRDDLPWDNPSGMLAWDLPVPWPVLTMSWCRQVRDSALVLAVFSLLTQT